jgi:hypothetical protein
VLIVTPHGYGLGGKQPLDGTLRPITRPFAATLAHDLPLAKKADGNALARAAMVAVRRIAAAGGPWLIAAVLLATLLLGALGVAVDRRVVSRDAGQNGRAMR